MVNALSSTLKRAKELAQKRRQSPSTAHVLVGLYQGDAGVREIALGLGVAEHALLLSLDQVYEERTNAIDLAFERARKLADALGAADVNALHVLHALAREPRCAANITLQQLGVSPDRLSSTCLAWLEELARIYANPGEPAAARASDFAGTPREGKGRSTSSVQLAMWKPGRREKQLEPAAVAADGGSTVTAFSESEEPAHPLNRHKRMQENRRRALLAQETESKLSRRPSSAPEGFGSSGPGDSAPQIGALNAALAGGEDRASGSLVEDGQVRPASGLERDSGAQLRSERGYAEPAADESAPRTGTRTRAATRPTAGTSSLVAPSSVTEETFQLDPERFPLLAGIGQNLTALAAAGRLDPVVGRDADVQRVLDVLARRRANNPILVGSPGVGKTAVAHGLAHAFVRSARAQQAPRVLIELSTSSLLSGTGVRGAVSERVLQLRSEVAESKGKVLLFIDEVHGLLGGGEADSLANELKTALARGELPLLGATTEAEYRRVFERDAALARRFTRIEIAEPSLSDTVEILRSLAPTYAQHHGVRYEPKALEAAVELSARYMPLRQLPDKAIALLDQAGARAQRNGVAVVDVRGVASVVSELAAVPVERLLMQDAEALLALERELAGRVVGQTAAISSIANALRKSAVGFRGARPLGTFLFTGPTGVGKTELARAISDVLFPGVPWTRIDMSELGQAHGVARLLGAPPGYLGHDDGGQLTEAVRNRPYQLVLLDEIEKAHVEVLLALLPLLDEGRMTDGRGRTVDFTNTVIVMTSNLGAECATARNRIGFDTDTSGPTDAARDRAIAAVRASLPPELFNRIDEALYFAPLGREDVAEIARRMLAKLVQVALDKHGIHVEFEPSSIDALIAAGGFDPTLGARPMRRTIGRLVEAPLARAVLSREVEAEGRVVLRGSGTRVQLSTEPKLARAAR
jgi:ATP-dependent Clp protease ATP-binding subunit ClpC